MKVRNTLVCESTRRSRRECGPNRSRTQTAATLGSRPRIMLRPLADQNPNKGCRVRASQPENFNGASVAATQMHGTPADVTG